jgi:hypothetical protein
MDILGRKVTVPKKILGRKTNHSYNILGRKGGRPAMQIGGRSNNGQPSVPYLEKR